MLSVARRQMFLYGGAKMLLGVVHPPDIQSIVSAQLQHSETQTHLHSHLDLGLCGHQGYEGHQRVSQLFWVAVRLLDREQLQLAPNDRMLLSQHVCNYDTLQLQGLEASKLGSPFWPLE